VGDLRLENMMCRRTVGPKALAQYTVRVSALLRGYAGPYRITKIHANFVELPFHAIGCIRARRRPIAAALSIPPVPPVISTVLPCIECVVRLIPMLASGSSEDGRP
jgi:hypothetical protein